MSNYIPRPGAQKKQNLLRQRELALRGAIRRGEPILDLLRLSENVRLAQLGLNKALIEITPATKLGKTADRKPVILVLQEEKVIWESISLKEIIEIYSEDPAKAPEPITRKRWWDFRRR